MDILFGLVCLALAAVVLIAARFWFSNQPAESATANIVSMLTATANTALIALGISELVHFVFNGAGVWRWIDGVIAIVGAIAVVAVVVVVMRRMQNRQAMPHA